MDGQVPVLPELGEVGGVPPVVVEVPGHHHLPSHVVHIPPVGELQQLAADVEQRVEEQPSAKQPQHVVGQGQPGPSIILGLSILVHTGQNYYCQV